MKKHKSVILFSEWKKPLQALSLEQKGRILDALLDFPDGIQPDFDDPLLLMAWAFMQGGLEENARKWDETREKRSEAGKRGNEKRWHSDNASRKNRKCDTCDESIANIAVSDSVSDSVSAKEISPIGDKEKDAAASHSPAKPKTERFHPPEPEEVRAYFAEKGGTADQAQRFRDFYESNGWRVGKNPMKSWKAAASGWIARDREKQNPANMPRGKAFLNTRPPEEAAKAGDFLADAARRRPLKKKGEPNAPIQSDP